MFLASTSDIVRIVTSAAVAIGVQAAWVDNASGSYAPGRTNTAIASATTTTVVASPGASTVRNLKSLIVTNEGAADCAITVQHYDGSTSVDIEKVTLAAGEQFIIAEDGELRHLTAFGAEYEPAAPDNYTGLGIAGTVGETIPRQLCTEAQTVIGATGAWFVTAVYLKAGALVSNISFFSGSTAAVTPTSQIFALFNRRGAAVAVSADDGATAWAANTIKTLAMATPYRVPATDLYWIGIVVAAATVPTVKGLGTQTGTQLAGIYPALHLSNPVASTGGLTPPTSSTNQVPWAAIT